MMIDRNRQLTWYLLAVSVTAVVVVVNHFLHADLDEPGASLIVMMLPLLLFARTGGLGPGLAATAVAIGLSVALIPGPAVDDPIDLVRWAALASAGAMLSLLGETLGRVRRHAAQERARSDRALRASDQRFRELAASIGEAFFMTKADLSETLYISPAWERIFGRSSAPLFAQPLSWLELVHADDRERVRHEARSEPPPEGRVSEFRIVRPDGELRWVRMTSFLGRDADGAPQRIAGVIADNTTQHVLEEQLRQAQKMESLGMLAGGVAHDFNNVLAVISSCNGLLLEGLAADHPDRELVEEIDDAVQRATAITRQLLAFSRKQVTEPVVLDLNAALTDTRKMLRRLVGEDVVVTTSLEPELHSVKIDPGNLVQIVMNLAVNARDAMPRGGSLHLATRNDGDHVVLSVSDTGAGISDDVKARIFEPFFTTKPVGRGTGMGLAVVHGIVDQAGGRLACESVVGAGSTFHVVLPAVAVRPAPAPEPRFAGHGTETIVMVDDDDYVRRAAARTLRSRGYTVLEARDGTTALDLLATRGADLLVTDVVMPGMDGRALADAAQRARPDLRVLYTSGYTDDAILRYGVAHAEVPFLEKPFPPQLLAGKVRQLLDA